MEKRRNCWEEEEEEERREREREREKDREKDGRVSVTNSHRQGGVNTHTQAERGKYPHKGREG